MNVIQSIVLGVVQGLGEFLPISSSGHLIVIPWLLGWREHTLSFDVMLHAGTLFAVVIYFWKDWVNLLREGLLSLRERSLRGVAERRLLWYIIVASVPGAIIGKLLEEKAETVFRNPLLIAGTMGGFAVIFYLIDRFSRRTRGLNALNIMDSILIGVSQALAIVPGISRSGITIACGLGLKLNREASAKFSFLLSTPIIFGATVLKIKDMFVLASGQQIISLLLGFIASAVTGFFAIHYLLSYVRKHTFNLFVIYRIIFSAIILSVFLFRK